jgi:hypothetical protein
VTARRLAAVACTAVSLAAFAAEPPAVVTLIESGGGALFRGTSRYVLQEGVRLQTGDIIEIGDKGVVEMEFADGVRLSLGPRARFYIGLLAPRGPKGPGLSDFYLMAGWTKFAAGKSAAPFRYTTPLFGLGTTEAIAVLQVTGAEGAMFVETGDVRVAEGFAKALRDSPVRLRGGQFYSRKPDQRGTIQQRPAPAFVAAMPRHYMDNLPTRLSRFKDREVPPRPAGELSYADVELWLKAPREIRRPVMQRFVRKADDPEFRRGLVANLRFHPEWDPILFPEKYEPKEPQPTALHPQPAPPQAGAPGPAATQ